MRIQKITTGELRTMNDREGLVLQGCGGDLREWVDGINQLLTDYGVFSDGARFEHALTFSHRGLTCLLFPFEDVRLDAGSWLSGGWRHIRILAAPGCLTLSPTNWAVSWGRSSPGNPNVPS